MNPKAREAFAKSVIEIGIAIFRGVMLVVFLLPATLIINSVVRDSSTQITLTSLLSPLSGMVWLFVGSWLVAGMLAGLFYRDKGIKLLHDMENEI